MERLEKFLTTANLTDGYIDDAAAPLDVDDFTVVEKTMEGTSERELMWYPHWIQGCFFLYWLQLL